MKRKASSSPKPSARKAVKVDDYCNVPLALDERGSPVWPAPDSQMSAARAFLRECAAAQAPTLIVPDKDADGLSAGVIVHRTLVKLGLSPENLQVHLVQKGSNIHEKSERKSMGEKEPKFVIVLDQGSRGGPPVIDDPTARSLIIDHHFSDEFPENAEVVSACHYPPVATTSLVAYEICKELHPDIASECGYLCAIGTHGDLGNTLKWLPPFPDMTETFKRHTKKLINDCVSYINAPRRTGTYDVITAWTALLSAATDPRQILNNARLAAARSEINFEVERHTHTAPKFSQDGKIAVLKIHSAAQVHPVIATRWAGHLKSRALEIVLVANYGYLAGKVNFSCRVARCARGRGREGEGEQAVDIIRVLKEVAARDETGALMARLGENFARGHREASGGIVDTDVFEEFCLLMRVGEKPERVEGEREGEATAVSGNKMKKTTKKEPQPQKNTLNNYFKKP